MRPLPLMLLFIAAGSCLAAPPPDSVVSAWFQMNALTVTESVPGDPDVTKYTFELTPDSDLRVRIESKEASGTLMLISGVLLSKDLPIQAGYEVDAIDSPALTMQLVNRLLAYAAGVQPSKVRGHRAVDLKEPSVPIRVATTSAEGVYGAPWHLKGSLNPSSPGSIAFDLSLSFKVKAAERYTMAFIGRWERRSPPPRLPDSLPLKGWRVFTFGISEHSDSQGTTMDYGAAPAAAAYETVGALRAAHRKDKP